MTDVKILRALDIVPPDCRGGAVTIGNFDGVHLGHARLIERLRAAAERVAGPAVVFTFDPHPMQLLRPAEAPPPLTWPERKCALLAELGVDVTVVYPTDSALLGLSAEDFFQRILVDRLAARAVVEGPNFFYGRGREGTIDRLRGQCAAAGLLLDVVEPVRTGGDLVSSSRVRQLLLDGRPEEARPLLTRPYHLRGEISSGARRGATLGFPTANIDRPETLVPGVGVYAGWGDVGDRRYSAAIHIGPNPTFGEDARKIEVHLLDFHGDIYGQMLEVEFLARLRDVTKFESKEALVAQLQRDIATTRMLCERASDR